MQDSFIARNIRCIVWIESPMQNTKVLYLQNVLIVMYYNI